MSDETLLISAVSEQKVYVYGPSATSEWLLQGTLESPSEAPDGGFGTAIQIDGDWIAVGEKGASTIA